MYILIQLNLKNTVIAENIYKIINKTLGDNPGLDFPVSPPRSGVISDFILLLGLRTNIAFPSNKLSTARRAGTEREHMTD